MDVSGDCEKNRLIFQCARLAAREVFICSRMYIICQFHFIIVIRVSKCIYIGVQTGR